MSLQDEHFRAKESNSISRKDYKKHYLGEWKPEEPKRLLAVRRALQHHGAFSNGGSLDAAIPNVVAGIMGKIARETMQEDVGDNIDRGLILLRKLNEAGLNVSFNKQP